MALRVLLADESSTIKKVIQLALQDYGVDVKSVPVGLDVLTVAKSFKPDIIFADVLLSKKSGYEVSQELKSDSATKNTPIILMWSGFMELDEEKATKSMANDRLEKPFDADVLRNLIRKYVPKTLGNPISAYLSFPPMPEFKDEGQQTPAEEFQAVPLRGPPQQSEESWSHQNLNQMQPTMTAASQPAPTSSVIEGQNEFDKFMIPEGDLGQPQIESAGEFEEVSFSQNHKNQLKPTATKTAALGEKVMSATETVLLERVARDEARAVISEICWKILPEIAERVVREEITKLLKQAEKEF